MATNGKVKRRKEDCSKRKSKAGRGLCKMKNLVRGHHPKKTKDRRQTA